MCESIGITSIGLSLYIYRPGKSYPFSKSDYTKFPQIKQLLLGLKLGKPVWPVGPTGRPLTCQIWLSIYAPLLFGEFQKPKSKNYHDVHVLHRAYKSKKNKTKGDIQYRSSSSSCTLPYARIELLQVPPIDSPW